MDSRSVLGAVDVRMERDKSEIPPESSMPLVFSEDGVREFEGAQSIKDPSTLGEKARSASTSASCARETPDINHEQPLINVPKRTWVIGVSASTQKAASEHRKRSKSQQANSRKKQLTEAMGKSRAEFKTYIITVSPGQDILSNIMSFSLDEPRDVCVLSANGALSNVTLLQEDTSGGSVTYEGWFEIMSLSGSFLLSESGGQRSRTGRLSVCLAGPDGRALGGAVAGLLTAASHVQVILGTFIADAGRDNKMMNPPEPVSAPGKLSIK